MSRNTSSHNEFNLQRMKKLMGVRRKQAADDGERSLIHSPSDASASISQYSPDGVSATDGDILDQDAPTSTFVYVLAFFSALGGFLFGYDTGVVSGAMLLLKKEMNLSSLWQELLVSSTVGAAAVSALAGGVLNGAFGRRICILISSFVFTVGGVLLSVAPDKEVLLAGRITVGLGIGKSVMVLGNFE